MFKTTIATLGVLLITFSFAHAQTGTTQFYGSDGQYQGSASQWPGPNNYQQYYGPSGEPSGHSFQMGNMTQFVGSNGQNGGTSWTLGVPQPNTVYAPNPGGPDLGGGN